MVGLLPDAQEAVAAMGITLNTTTITFCISLGFAGAPSLPGSLPAKCACLPGLCGWVAGLSSRIVPLQPCLTWLALRAAQDGSHRGGSSAWVLRNPSRG